MSHSPKRPRLRFQQDFQALMEPEDLLGAQVPTAEAEVPAAGMCSIPRRPQSSRPFSTSWNTSGEASGSQGQGDTSAWRVLPDPEFPLTHEIDKKVGELVKFLLLKYRAKEPIRKAEMLNIVFSIYKDHSPELFRKAYDFIELVFGIAMTEVDPSNHSYVSANTLKLTYDGVMINNQGMPKTSLLILILSVIFSKGKRAPEEYIWEVLSSIGVYAGREHFIYGEPRKLITTDFVQEQFLEYRQVPNSDPARYEFLWGPKAHTEITKRKVLEFLAKVNSVVPSSVPTRYRDALTDVEERAHAIIDAANDASAMASGSSSVTSSSFSRPDRCLRQIPYCVWEKGSRGSQ
ncbi:PREDICTED: melanoma-associated antigen C2-like [Galeopterus variegatus]|uniref:Melanoma-associated antigen C2-like n=1 Tax=Galeopterus variegatus TaxID=482537 RepID=A0ABM0RWI7_GALVR|nr:PREDICTED: melanoma-associated antigen C2-like [Galeopterus variegatus]